MAERTFVDVADKALDMIGGGAGAITEVVSKIVDKSSNIFEAVGKAVSSAASEYGPQVMDAILWTIRVDKGAELIYGWVLLLFAFVLMYHFVYNSFIATGDISSSNEEKIKRLKASRTVEGRPRSMTDLYAILCVAACITSGALVMKAAPKVVNPWNYVAVVKPELYLVKLVVLNIESRISNSVTTNVTSK